MRGRNVLRRVSVLQALYPMNSSEWSFSPKTSYHSEFDVRDHWSNAHRKIIIVRRLFGLARYPHGFLLRLGDFHWWRRDCARLDSRLNINAHVTGLELGARWQAALYVESLILHRPSYFPLFGQLEETCTYCSFFLPIVSSPTAWRSSFHHRRNVGWQSQLTCD